MLKSTDSIMSQICCLAEVQHFNFIALPYCMFSLCQSTGLNVWSENRSKNIYMFSHCILSSFNSERGSDPLNITSTETTYEYTKQWSCN